MIKNNYALWLCCCLFVITTTTKLSHGQAFPVPGGLVPPGVQTCFQFSVNVNPSNLVLGDPTTGPWPLAAIDSFELNILTSHPWTLEITLVSPAGTVLTLSSFNGAGGVNYTDTDFMPGPGNSIVGAPAPFTGNWQPQQYPPGFGIFDGESPNGTWQLCILDTLTDSTGIAIGPPGIGATSSASGTIGISTGNCPPCSTLTGPNLPPLDYYVCAYESVDLIGPYLPAIAGTNMIIEAFDMWGNPVSSGCINTNGYVYSIVVTDNGCGCQWGTMVTLFEIPAFQINPDQLINQCQNAPIDLNSLMGVNSAASFSWTHNGMPISIATAAAASLPGIYVVNVDELTGIYCAVAGTVEIIELIAPDMGPDQLIAGCTISSVDLSGLFPTAGLTTDWTLNGLPVMNPSNVNGNGNYMLVVTDINGCKDTAVVTINLTPPPSLGIDQSLDFCGTSYVDLTALYNTSGLTADWTMLGVPISNPAAVNTAGTYTLIASNVNGCSDTAEVILNMLSTPALGVDQTIIGCTLSPYDLTLLYNTTGYTTSWYRNGNLVANPAAVVVNGNYMLVATDPSGCSDTAMVSLNMSLGPVLGTDQAVNACLGSSVNLTSLYSTGSFQTNWTLAGVPVASPANVTTAGVYTLIASNSNGCADTAQVTVTISNPPAIGLDQAHDICSNTVIDLTSLYTTTGLTTSWTLNSVIVSNPSSISAAGIYTITATDLNGCTDQAEVTINSLAAPGLGPDQNTAYCPGMTTDLSTLFNTTGFTISWTLSGTVIPNVSSINVAGTYQLVATSLNGCTDTANTVVIEGTVPVLGSSQQITSCDNQPVNLTTIYNTAGNTTAWTLNGAAVTNPSGVTTTGIYQIVCTNPAGCTATANVTLAVNQAPVLGNDQVITACSGSVLDLTSLYPLAGLTPQWTLNGASVSNPSAVTVNGIYQLIATNASNCSDTALVDYTLNAVPALGADQSVILCQWMTVNLNTLYSITGLNATWTFNGQSVQNLTAAYDSGAYQLAVSDVNGCVDTAVVNVSNEYCECNLDFTYQGKCSDEPVSFAVVADSAITSTHWSFSNPMIPESYILNPTVVFPSSESVLVTLEAVLSCGTRVVEREVKMDNCADSCRVYFPNAFTPNRDGKNEGFKSVTECFPLSYEMEIWNRYGQVIFKTEDHSQAWDGRDDPEGVYLYTVEYQMPYQKKKTVSGRVTVLR